MHSSAEKSQTKYFAAVLRHLHILLHFLRFYQPMLPRLGEKEPFAVVAIHASILPRFHRLVKEIVPSWLQPGDYFKIWPLILSYMPPSCCENHNISCIMISNRIKMIKIGISRLCILSEQNAPYK